MSKHDFRGFHPANIDTFAAVWLGKARHCMRMACEHARRAQWWSVEHSSILAHEHLSLSWWFIGQADAACSVLYDVNHDRAYATLCRLSSVKRAVKRATKGGAL